MGEAKRKHTEAKERNGRKKTERRIVSGRFSANPAGFGFVTPENASGKDIFIPPKDVHGALHGDSVKVEITNEDRDERGPVGRVVGIAERFI